VVILHLLDAKWTRWNALHDGFDISSLYINNYFYTNFESSKLFIFLMSPLLLHSLKEFLPQSYAKVKGIEKKVFAEHKKHVGLSELDAKVLYTKTARSLKTYGVTFFLVKVLCQETGGIRG
jgi:hypothetical protein